MTRKRKIMLGGAGVLAALALMPVLLAGLDLWRATRRVAEFESRHADAPRQAEAAATRVSRLLRPSRVVTAATATTPTLIRRDIGPIGRTFGKLCGEYEKAGVWLVRGRPLLRGGIDGMMLVLPAVEFVQPKAPMPLSDRPALRQFILGETEAQLARPRYRPAKPLPRDALTSGPLAARLAQAMDQAGDILTSDWDELTASPSPVGCVDFFWLSVLAIEREVRRGNSMAAARMLEGLVRAAPLLHLKNYPFGIPNRDLQRTVIRLTRQGMLDDAALARLERLLAAGRLGDAEVASLRATFAKTQIERFKETLASQERTGGGVAKYVKVPMEKVVLNDYFAALAAWGAGDGRAFDDALANPLALTFIMPKIQNGECPGHQAGFGGESAANDALDTTRLIVAAERYRLARGEYPVKLEDLRPGYVDATFDARAGSFWGVARLEPKSGDGATTKTLARPVFYHAWRTPLSAVRYWTLSAGFDDLRTVDGIGMVGAKERHPWLDKLGLVNESQMLDLWSNRSAEAVVVRVVWPQLEEMEWAWF